MGAIKDTTAAIVAALIADTVLTDNVLTSGAGTLDEILESEDVSFPAVLVMYSGGEYGDHETTATLVDAERSWTVCVIAKSTGPTSDPSGDAADMLERIVAVLLGMTVDGGAGELWPAGDELTYSARGRVAYSVNFKADTRTVGV